MKRFNIQVVVIGSQVMLAIDQLSGVVLFTVFGGDAMTAGASQDELSAVGKIIEQDNGYLLVGLLLGTLSTVLGRFVAARMAKTLPLLNACAVGVVGIAAGVLLGGQSDSPWWFNAAGYLSTIPAAMVCGGWARRAIRPGP